MARYTGWAEAKSRKLKGGYIRYKDPFKRGANAPKEFVKKRKRIRNVFRVGTGKIETQKTKRDITVLKGKEGILAHPWGSDPVAKEMRAKWKTKEPPQYKLVGTKFKLIRTRKRKRKG